MSKKKEVKIDVDFLKNLTYALTLGIENTEQLAAIYEEDRLEYSKESNVFSVYRVKLLEIIDGIKENE